MKANVAATKTILKETDIGTYISIVGFRFMCMGKVCGSYLV